MKIEGLAALYPWIKALHIIAVMAWMAALLYLPRLFVYHCDTVPGSAESERFKVMEARLQTIIGTPAMLAAWLFGILLVLTPGTMSWNEGWWHVKLLGVIVLSGLHGMMSAWRRRFRDDANRRPAAFYRVMNEVPTLLMIIIVLMVVVRPF